eukprot:COSAG05_NODE_2064_length_3620_cov_1.541323_6_plen_242_part_00
MDRTRLSQGEMRKARRQGDEMRLDRAQSATRNTRRQVRQTRRRHLATSSCGDLALEDGNTPSQAAIAHNVDKSSSREERRAAREARRRPKDESQESHGSGGVENNSSGAINRGDAKDGDTHDGHRLSREERRAAREARRRPKDESQESHGSTAGANSAEDLENGGGAPRQICHEAVHDGHRPSWKVEQVEQEAVHAADSSQEQDKRDAINGKLTTVHCVRTPILSKSRFQRQNFSKTMRNC